MQGLTLRALLEAEAEPARTKPVPIVAFVARLEAPRDIVTKKGAQLAIAKLLLHDESATFVPLTLFEDTARRWAGAAAADAARPRALPVQTGDVVLLTNIVATDFRGSIGLRPMWSSFCYILDRGAADFARPAAAARGAVPPGALPHFSTPSAPLIKRWAAVRDFAQREYPHLLMQHDLLPAPLPHTSASSSSRSSAAAAAPLGDVIESAEQLLTTPPNVDVSVHATVRGVSAAPTSAASTRTSGGKPILRGTALLQLAASPSVLVALKVYQFPPSAAHPSQAQGGAADMLMRELSSSRDVVVTRLRLVHSAAEDCRVLTSTVETRVTSAAVLKRSGRGHTAAVASVAEQDGAAGDHADDVAAAREPRSKRAKLDVSVESNGSAMESVKLQPELAAQVPLLEPLEFPTTQADMAFCALEAADDAGGRSSAAESSSSSTSAAAALAFVPRRLELPAHFQCVCWPDVGLYFGVASATGAAASASSTTQQRHTQATQFPLLRTHYGATQQSSLALGGNGGMLLPSQLLRPGTLAAPHGGGSTLAPSAASVPPSFRALTPADVPSLLLTVCSLCESVVTPDAKGITSCSACSAFPPVGTDASSSTAAGGKRYSFPVWAWRRGWALLSSGRRKCWVAVDSQGVWEALLAGLTAEAVAELLHARSSSSTTATAIGKDAVPVDAALVALLTSLTASGSVQRQQLGVALQLVRDAHMRGGRAMTHFGLERLSVD